MSAVVIWTAALALQGLALLMAVLAGHKSQAERPAEAGGWFLAALGLGLLALTLMVTT